MKLKGLMPNINNPASVAGTLQNLLGGPKNPSAGQTQQNTAAATKSGATDHGNIREEEATKRTTTKIRPSGSAV
jgi:hypothetical protein